MTDRPILFSGPMVRALLDGRKTMTRRVLKPQPVRFWRDRQNPGCWEQDHFVRLYEGIWPDGTRSVQSWNYAPGDRLWCREQWRPQWDAEIFMCVEYRADGARAKPHITDDNQGGRFEEMADRCNPDAESLYGPLPPNRWRPSIHMPRWASRLTLTVTEVRVQRVQEISEADARAEGVVPTDIERLDPDCPVCRGSGVDSDIAAKNARDRDNEDVRCGPCSLLAFELLWDSLNAKRGYGWDVNPWVVALTFTVEHRNIDSMVAA